MITLIAPAGTSNATGIGGNAYEIGDNRQVQVHDADVAGFIAAGWTLPPVLAWGEGGDADRITVDGANFGPHLTGPTGDTGPAIASGTPASASATGTAGTVLYDADYLYVCIATDTWVRAALSTWA